MTITDRPLHPLDEHPELFQHPIKGFVIRYPDSLACRANDVGERGSVNDTNIYVGVEVFRARCELGQWLDKCHPENEMLNHLFVELVFPCDFEGEYDVADQAALLGRVDTAGSVISAGGACTICDAPNIDGHVEHAVGCEFMSWVLYNIAKQALDADGEPSLSEVVRAANEQIDRMQ